MLSKDKVLVSRGRLTDEEILEMSGLFARPRFNIRVVGIRVLVEWTQ